MSYHALKTNDLTLNMIYDQQNFFRCLPNMERARDEENFDTWLIWFEQLKVIDKRLLIRYMRKEQKNYPEYWVHLANRMLDYRVLGKEKKENSDGE
jgi:hypothetical protein